MVVRLKSIKYHRAKLAHKTTLLIRLVYDSVRPFYSDQALYDIDAGLMNDIYITATPRSTNGIKKDHLAEAYFHQSFAFAFSCFVPYPYPYPYPSFLGSIPFTSKVMFGNLFS